MDTKKKVFPCDFCSEGICPLSGEECPAVKDIKGFLRRINPENIIQAYEEYLKLTGFGVI